MMTNPEHIGHPLTYVLTTGVLLVLTGLNVVLSGLDLGPLYTFIALAIAGIEVVVMVLVFMRLRSSPAMTRLAAIAGLFWLGILLSGTLDDVLTRGWLPIPGK
jgi:cytochrome c oxidase subunit IV